MSLLTNPWFWTSLLVLHAYSAMLGAMIARQRANLPAGAALGLVLGLWGVPLAFFVKDQRDMCPRCKGRALEWGERCPHCGQDARPIPAPR